jgi:excisionase family DNA binding protein
MTFFCVGDQALPACSFNWKETLTMDNTLLSDDFGPAYPTVVSSADRPAVKPSAEPLFLTYAQVARIFGRSPRTVRLWVASGRLHAIRIGRARLIPRAEIERLAMEDTPALAPCDARVAAGANKADPHAVDTKNPAPEAVSEAAE